jgi:hypothetical protein
MDAAETARLMNRYARAHAGGAFASPTAAELDAHGWLALPGPVVAAVTRPATRTVREDWTGARYHLPPGVALGKFVARAADVTTIPDGLAVLDVAFVYADDPVLSGWFCAAGYRRHATRVSSTSEIFTCWARRGMLAPRREQPADRPTAEPVDVLVHPSALREMVSELATVDRWHDDYPYYSDGTWSAVNLRGYRADDPLWGVKPAEMPRKWQREHPEALAYRCEWTSITDRLPAMRATVDRLVVALGCDDLQRVRLMRMAAKPGGGKLARHSDVTDRQAGTRDGLVARFHIPIVTHPDITMSVWELDGRRRDVHLAPGEIWYLDQRKPHAVTNPAPCDRVHLVVDVIVNATVRKHLERAGEPT